MSYPQHSPPLSRIVRTVVWACFLVYAIFFLIAAASYQRGSGNDAHRAIVNLMESAFFYVFAVCFALDRICSD